MPSSRTKEFEMGHLSSRRRLLVAGVAMFCAGIAVPSPAQASPGADGHGHGQQSEVTLFPTDALTVRDNAQLTRRRVALPLPDCTVSPTDCATIRQLNQLDGFDIDPRLALSFDHAVDPNTVAAATTVTRQDGRHEASLGVDRVVYDASTNTVYAHPDGQLAPDTRYRLRLRGDRRNGLPSAGTVFTTESATVGLLDMRAQLDSGLAYLRAGIARDARGLQIDANVPAAGTTLTYTQDEGTIGALHTVPVPNTSATAAARYVFGSFLAPNWIDADSVIPQTPTRGPGPTVLGQRRLPFVLIVPAGTEPAGGWPAAIFGHGFTGSGAHPFLAPRPNASRLPPMNTTPTKPRPRGAARTTPVPPAGVVNTRSSPLSHRAPARRRSSSWRCRWTRSASTAPGVHGSVRRDRLVFGSTLTRRPSTLCNAHRKLRRAPSRSTSSQRSPSSSPCLKPVASATSTIWATRCPLTAAMMASAPAGVIAGTGFDTTRGRSTYCAALWPTRRRRMASLRAVRRTSRTIATVRGARPRSWMPMQRRCTWSGVNRSSRTLPSSGTMCTETISAYLSTVDGRTRRRERDSQPSRNAATV